MIFRFGKIRCKQRDIIEVLTFIHECKIAIVLNAVYSTICARIFLIELPSQYHVRPIASTIMHHARRYAPNAQTTRTPVTYF